MTLKCKKATNPTKRPMIVPEELFLSEKVRKMNQEALRIIAKRGM
ncbi:hypothetical protein [Fredinandcohnia quinoae]|nr:hypothetical protein [Fredinandcohnia sp. SECRCQ15]